MVSCEVGAEKPSPLIFRAALGRGFWGKGLRVMSLSTTAHQRVGAEGLGVELCDSGRVVHVGDDEEADERGAKAVGMEAW